jgi:uncharacterized protein YcbK (DUF882 family)
MAWQYFTKDEFACMCGNCANLMDDTFIDKLDKLRSLFGFAFPVNSGYRCPAHNVTVSTTGPNGPHTTGRAVDLGLRGLQAFMVLSIAMDSTEFTGVGVKQHGASRFLHLDDLAQPAHPRPNVWSYP